MIRVVRIACCLSPLVVGTVATAQERVLVRTRLEPERAVVGQQARLLVDVLFPGAMAHPPRVEPPRVEGAQIFRFESQATNLSDQVAGRTYIGQRFEFDIYPRRAGVLQVPAVRVTLLDATGGETGALIGSAQVLRATVPPGLDPSQPIVAANHVTLRESWEPAATTFHAGDALTRTITRTADGVPGLALANLSFPVPDGVRAYVDPPSVQDRVQRGEVTGQRTDRVTYVMERAGRFVLPGLTQPWWNLAAGHAESLTRPPLHVAVQAEPSGSRVAEASPGARIWLGSGAVVLAGTLFLGAVFRGRVASWLVASRAARSNSEGRAFSALLSACRTGAAPRIYHAWQRWIALCQREGNAVAKRPETLSRLESCLFGGRTVWNAVDSAVLADELREVRIRMHDQSRSRPRSTTLPGLNPV